MRTRAALIAIGVAAMAAASGHAQAPPVDPIDALLSQPAKDADPDEPDTAAAGPKTDADPTPLPASTAQPTPQPVQRSTLTRPVHLEETGKTSDGPPTSDDLAYDSRLKSSMASAQSFQGPMEGGWTLVAGGRELYAFQLVDRNGAVEGAWRDVRRVGALDASGFIDQVERTDGAMTLRIGALVVVLHANADGRWVGEITEAGRTQAVSLRRRTP